MDTKIIKKIAAQLEADRERDKEFAAYDDMDKMRWELPEGLAEKDWARKKVSTAPHDVLKTGVNIFNTSFPKWSIQPRSPQDGEWADKSERWLEWQMRLSNDRGVGDPFREIMEQAIKYSVVCTQLDYLPYWINGSDPRSKRLRASGAFCVSTYEPSTVHYAIGKYGLVWVACVTNSTAGAIADHWATYGAGDKKIERAVKKLYELDAEEMRVCYVDYTDKDVRFVYAYETGNVSVDETAGEDVEDKIVILDTKNELPFIPWVIVAGRDDPLLAPLHRGNIWDNQNLLQTVIMSSTFRRSFFPLLDETTIDGQPLQVDYSGDHDSIPHRPGEDVRVLQPPPIDPALRELALGVDAEMSGATGLRQIQNANLVGNIQFATVNAMIQISMTSLEPYRRTAERALKQLGIMAFDWVTYTKDTVKGFRSSTNQYGKKGEQLDMGPDDFDMESLYVSCELLANTPTDELQRTNMYTMMSREGWPIPTSEFIERMGFGAPEPLKEAWTKEQLEKAALQTFIKQKDVEAQLIEQQKQMQAWQFNQQQAQQQVQQQGQPGFEGQGGQGMNPAAGGSSPYEGAPQLTQSQPPNGGPPPGM